MCSRWIVRALAGAAFVVAGPITAQADTYIRLTGENAGVDANGNVSQNGVFYPFIYKPSPLPWWVSRPWISPTEAYRTGSAIGFDIQGTPADQTTATGTDKANLRLSSGNDWFALGFDNERYTGFALKLGDWTSPSRSLLVAQWWQGSPYSPPLSMHIVPGTNRFVFEVRNNDTGGNPSAQVITLEPSDGGDLDPTVWHAFVVYTRMHFVGQYDGSGKVQVWHNGALVIDWDGNIGYDPSRAVAVNGNPDDPQQATNPKPNPRFDIFIGPYREQQPEHQQLYFDEVRIGSTYQDADPAN